MCIFTTIVHVISFRRADGFSVPLSGADAGKAHAKIDFDLLLCRDVFSCVTRRGLFKGIGALQEALEKCTKLVFRGVPTFPSAKAGYMCVLFKFLTHCDLKDP